MHGISFLYTNRIIWFIAMAVFAAIWITIKIFRNMNQQAEQSKKVAQRLNWLLLLSGMVIVLGCIGYFWNMQNAVCRDNLLPGSSWLTIITTVVESTEQLHAIADCYIKSTSAILSGLLTTLCIAPIWFALRQRVVSR